MNFRTTNQIGIFILLSACFAFPGMENVKALSRNLPYKTGWDNANDQAGWTLHQLKSTKYGSWGIGGNAPPSTPYNIDHDYPVDNQNADTVDDWYISPSLNIPGKSHISLKANVFVIGMQQPTDECSIWYSTSSNDPASGSFKKLADITSWASNKFTNWRDTAGILLNDSGTSVFIAIRYRETTNWFTVGVDDFEVDAIHTAGINDGATILNDVAVYPNPSSGSFLIKLPAEMATKKAELRIFDVNGNQMYFIETKGNQEILFNDERLIPGVYIYRILGKAGEFYNGRFIIN